MFRNEKLELKVGLFIGLGIFIGFLIVFSLSDVYLLQKGYKVNVLFDFVNGIKQNAPIRLAGVNVGEVKEIHLYYDENAKRTRVRLGLWIAGDAKLETDCVARINTLGLLGEQYLEITPGKADRFLKPGDNIDGRNPINVGMQMEKMSELVGSASKMFKSVSEGKGTIGKLIMDDTIYNDLETIFGRLADGEGTIGKLLAKDDIYNDVEELVSDIKAHPWKLLHKTKEKKTSSRSSSRGTSVSTR